MIEGKLNELALFSGVGGGLLGSRLLGWNTVCAVEVDSYCRKILFQRQRDGCLERFPVWDDIKTFAGYEWRGRIDVITAGFPCPAFSSARGKQNPDPYRNKKNLWGHTIRIINEVKPTWLLLENVSGLLFGSHGYFGKILRDLAKGGYDVEWDMLSAADEGADHIRDRLWIFGNTNGQGKSTRSIDAKTSVVSTVVANFFGESQPNGCRPTTSKRKIRRVRDAWEIQPGLDRLANGVPGWVDRIRAAGNAQVPQVVARAWRELSN